MISSISPRYSILLCNQALAEYKEMISEWLHDGIKVFWFGQEEDIEVLKKEHVTFAKEFLLQTYVVPLDKKAGEPKYVFTKQTVIIDGFNTSTDNTDAENRDDAEYYISRLEQVCPSFNAAQYRVEHCKSEEHIVVQASAGTGKTTVMIDRIMYLMHTVPGIQMSDIYMITFTNDAANQMNLRLQEMLMKRFHLTGNIRYFRWLEEQSQMNISTIHSFAYMMLKECGIGQSFTRNLSIRNFKHEKKELIKDIMEEYATDVVSIKSQVGVSLYKANSLVEQYWKGFGKLGISHTDMEKMDWGNPEDENSVAFQKLISSVTGKLDEDYFEIKRRNDAIALNDIMRDLQDVLLGNEKICPDISMKYLFIDEFQDSDLSQIMVAALLVKLLGAKLFVVGDIKQSIYRFRGATDQAFDILYRDLEEVNAKPAKKFILINNYRTAANIMNRMNNYFSKWGEDGLLKYDGPVIPFNQSKGTMKMMEGDIDQRIEDDMIADLVREQLELLIEKIEKSGKRPGSKDRVVMLTRTNNELIKLSKLLRKNQIPATVSREGSFFICEAVRDFFSMIGSYLFMSEPKYIFNYLLTPYAGEIEPVDIHVMECLDGNKEKLQEYLSHFLHQTNWAKYYKKFRLYPVMSVIKNIMDEEQVVDNFIINYKKRLTESGWAENRCIASARTKAMQYQADLEKLLEILQNNLRGDKISLYDIYKYLKLQIATNRSESEPNVESEDDYTSVLCMTVHKSKGLEFDTVIIPYTHRRFPDQYSTEILIDPVNKKAGWNFAADKKNPNMRNDLYVELKNEDVQRIREEETRILYVAMTRAINNLYCIVHPAKDSYRWAYLIEEVGLDYE